MVKVNTKDSLASHTLKNPAFGLIPLLLVSFFITTYDTTFLLAGGFLLSIIGFAITKKYSRYIYQVSILSFGVTFILSYFVTPNLDSFRQFVFVEVIFVASLIVMRQFRIKFINKVFKSQTLNNKNYISESLRIAFQSQYALMIHILIVLVYFMLNQTEYYLYNTLVIIVLVQILLLSIIVGEVVRLHLLREKLKVEEWLPILNESGDVEGKVAKSVSVNLKNKFLHPVVRVALLHKGMFYLKPRLQNRILNPGALDYPFEKYMIYDHNLDDAVHNSVVKELGVDILPSRFILKYIFQNEITKRLIYLYVSEINDEEIFNSLPLQGGKLWTENQIEANLGKGIFSETFEEEYEYLKNTVLMTYKFKK